MVDQLLAQEALRARLGQLNILMDISEACAARKEFRVGKAIFDQATIVRNRCVELYGQSGLRRG